MIHDVGALSVAAKNRFLQVLPQAVGAFHRFCEVTNHVGGFHPQSVSECENLLHCQKQIVPLSDPIYSEIKKYSRNFATIRRPPRRQLSVCKCAFRHNVCQRPGRPQEVSTYVRFTTKTNFSGSKIMISIQPRNEKPMRPTRARPWHKRRARFDLFAL